MSSQLDKSPAIIGADVCHLNLHKTSLFLTVVVDLVGPIGVVEHLKNFLPNSSIISTGGDMGMSISSAPWKCIGNYNFICFTYSCWEQMG